MNAYSSLLEKMPGQPKTWLVTGAAGFIGSNLVEALLKQGQNVRGLDNFATGHAENLEMVRLNVGERAWASFSFQEADIRSLESCRQACSGVEIILHQAALGSVPRSLEDPICTNASNIDGFLHMLVAARDSGVRNFVYAASSSTYGDEPNLPKREDRIGAPLSPYAVTKYVNELYAKVFARAYGLRCIGLRYFNIFGERQDPNGAYAAVIPKWFAALLRGEQVFINGDGESSRDFCFIENCVQANLLAGSCEKEEAWNQVYNIAVGQRNSLNELFRLLKLEVSGFHPEAARAEAAYRDFRPGDVRHSLADISKAQALLGYAPEYDLQRGLQRVAPWYAAHL